MRVETLVSCRDMQKIEIANEMSLFQGECHCQTMETSVSMQETADPHRKNAAGMLKITASLSTPPFVNARPHRYVTYIPK